MLGAIIGAKAMDHKATPYVVIVIIVLVLTFVYFGVIRPAMCKVGLWDCGVNKSAQKIMSFEGFDPNFSRASEVTITHDRAKSLAKQMYDAGGVFNDDESAIYSVLEQAGNRDNLSLISRMFSAKYSKSIAEHIAYYLDSPEEMDRIETILSKY